MLDSIVNVLIQLHFQYLEQFLVALLPMSLTVFLHGQGMRFVALYLKRFSRHAIQGSRDSRFHISLIVVVAIMLLSHFIEITFWAIFFFLTEMVPDYRSAMNLSVNSYTTLGASNVTLPVRWQGVDGFESMSAMLMFGWSTAVLANVIGKTDSIPGDNTR